ncbi:unnamed protein product [Adineta steineri]|uniref:Uncharacterized protein n=1 Tax=Adineta steineri TaxID=433720 RepID=A0A814PR89_9BILA|nr:unnamed protein product [Adineta steineri]
MIGTRHRQDLTSSSICSTCSTASTNARWNDISSRAKFNPTIVTSQRPIIKSTRRCIISSVPPSWSPVSSVLPQTTTLRDFCLPRQEPRPPNDVLNRSPLSSCSPSLAKFSRTSLGQHVSISTSTTTLPSTINPNNTLHPPMSYLTVTGLNIHHQRRHTR